MKVYGHRGATDVAPENTLASFEAACKIGCHAVECDIHYTADKQIVIIHTDYELAAMWGKEGGAVEKMTLAELRSLRLVGVDEKFADEKIPTLDEFYTLMKKYPQVDMNVEIKTQQYEFYEKIVATTAKYRLLDRVLYSASAPHTLNWFGEKHPDIPFSVSPLTFEDADYARGFQYKCNCVLVQPYFEVVDEEYVKNAHKLNLQVTPWTVDTPENFVRMTKCGVDGVITNNPGLILNLIKDAKGEAK